MPAWLILGLPYNLLLLHGVSQAYNQLSCTEMEPSASVNYFCNLATRIILLRTAGTEGIVKFHLCIHVLFLILTEEICNEQDGMVYFEA